MNQLPSSTLSARRWTTADLVARFGSLPQGRVRVQPCRAWPPKRTSNARETLANAAAS